MKINLIKAPRNRFWGGALVKKAILSAILVISMVVLLIPVSVSAADGTPVSTVEEFEAMESGGTYYLANDIDFGGKQYECYILAEFSGVLNGNGYTIYNFTLTNGEQESDVGIIKRANKTGNLEITNLNIGKADQPVVLTTSASGKSSGVIAGAQENANNAVLTGVNVYATVKGTSAGKANVGGFIGYSRAVNFTDCSFNGTVEVGSGLDQADEVYHNAAGFIASCNSALTFFTNCENNGDITTYCSSTEARAAGFVSYTACSITFENCRNNGDITVEDCGLQIADGQCAGFVGHANKTDLVLFENCQNYGRITASNWSSGFVAKASSGAIFTTCTNEGDYGKDKAILSGPFVAYAADTAIVDYEGECIDKIDLSVTWGSADTTTEAPTTTPTPVETTTEASTTTSEPVVDQITTTVAPTTTPTPTTTTAAGGDSEGGCGSVMVSAALVAVLGAGWIVLRKKEN